MSSADCITTRIAYFVIDIGKNVHWLAAYAGPRLAPVIAPQKVRANLAGFEQVAERLQEMLTGGQFDTVVMGHEPTGIYHEAFSRALQARFGHYATARTPPWLEYRFVNPYQVKQARQRRVGRNRKTDQLDLAAIAHCLADGAGVPPYLPSAADLPFRLWGARLRQLSRAQRQLTHRLLTALDQLWPGALVDVRRFRQAHPELEPPVPLVLSEPLERRLIQALLTHAPDPHQIRRMTRAQLIALLRQQVGRGGPATADRILACARDALLPPPEITAVLARQVQADFAFYQNLAERLAQLKAEAEQLLPGSSAAVLTSVPGLTPYLAARYLAGIGQATRFDSAAQVWSLAGLDPLSADSGDTRRAGHISKKGDPAFRDTLYLLGFQTSQACPPIALAKARALERGLGFTGAVLHAAHKANRLCWHLLIHQEPYQPPRH